MKNFALVMGACGALAMSAWACGSDVESNPGGSGGAGASGGAGGTGGMTTSTGGMGGTGGTGTGTGTGMTMTCDGPFGNTCLEACCIAETECGASGLCGLAGMVGIDLNTCGDATALCAADCIIDAKAAGDVCPDILALYGFDFNTPLGQCLTGCQMTTPCQGCITDSCSNEVGACTQDADNTCQDYAQCLVGCGDGDAACIEGCATQYAGDTEVDALSGCIAGSCGMECLSTGQGGGGQGGSSGQGGAMN